MVELQESGRYDDAVRVVQDWMSKDQKDVSQNDFLHLQIAMVYLIKAYHKQSARKESLHNADSHLEQALSIFNSKQPQDLETTLLGIGGAYEVLADLSEKDKCQFYEKARVSFERQLPLIRGDSFTAYGTTVPLEPVRNETRKQLKSVGEKLTEAGCSTPGAH